MKKLDMVKVITVVGTVMSLAGTLCSSWASDKKLEETVQKQVDEALKSKIKGS